MSANNFKRECIFLFRERKVGFLEDITFDLSLDELVGFWQVGMGNTYAHSMFN